MWAGGEAVGAHDRLQLNLTSQRNRAACGQSYGVTVPQASPCHADLVHEDPIPVFFSDKDPRRALPRRTLLRKRFFQKRFTILPENAAKRPMLSKRSASTQWPCVCWCTEHSLRLHHPWVPNLACRFRSHTGILGLLGSPCVDARGTIPPDVDVRGAGTTDDGLFAIKGDLWRDCDVPAQLQPKHCAQPENDKPHSSGGLITYQGLSPGT